ncbi:MAG: transporter [Actinobacteria bacterium]|nr:MAG: transporter [Actinomycetota bacterium]
MIWVTWRQHRAQFLGGAIALALLGGILLLTGPRIASSFHDGGLASCLSTRGADCGDLADRFLNQYNNMWFVAVLFLVVPAFAGVFWGAPMVARELEQGTHRLAWTQGVTRGRWLSAKLIGILAATVVGAAILSISIARWSYPLVRASDNRFIPPVFDLRGIVVGGYALFVVALGVAFGTLFRRVVPAMAATFGGYAAVRVPIDVWLRKRYMSPKVISFPLFGKGGPGIGFGRGDWILSSRIVDAAGHALSSRGGIDIDALASRCPSLQGVQFPGKDDLGTCLQHIGARTVNVYQPGSRYWPFQFIELGIFVLLAAGLVAFTFWWVRRRVS